MPPAAASKEEKVAWKRGPSRVAAAEREGLSLRGESEHSLRSTLARLLKLEKMAFIVNEARTRCFSLEAISLGRRGAGLAVTHVVDEPVTWSDGHHGGCLSGSNSKLKEKKGRRQHREGRKGAR